MSEDLQAESQREDPWNMWLALEIRRARIAFGERKPEDDHLVASGHRKGGARVKLILRWMEKIAVPLADATISQAKAFSSTPEALERARLEVAKFLKEMSAAAITMASFVAVDSNSAHTATTRRIQALSDDVNGAFRLAAASSSTALRSSPVFEERTGDPGRPELGAALYQAEFERRASAKEIETELVDEAKALLRWFKLQHPQRQAPTVKTIRNRIRARHRQAVHEINMAG